MDMAIRIEENVVWLYIPDYREIGSIYGKEMIDDEERGRKCGNLGIQIYLWMIRWS